MREARSRSPYDAKRFLYQEDSMTWPNSRDSSHKLVRFASTNSISSEKADHLPTPHSRVSKSSYTKAFPQTSLLIAVSLLLIPLLLHLFPRVGLNFSRYQHHWQILSLLPSASRHATSDLPPSPALRQYIEDIVREQIRAHISASRGLRDFALKAAGARIVPELTTGCSHLFSWDCDGPSIAIDDDVRVGKCWNVPTLPAQLAVVLPELIYPSHVTVEHLPRSIAPDIHAAPRNLTLWGIVDGKSNTALYETLRLSNPEIGAMRDHHPMISKSHSYASLLSFTYDINNENPIQTFEIRKPFIEANMSFAVFVLEMSDNWGGPGSTTCLYRARIHGMPV